MQIEKEQLAEMYGNYQRLVIGVARNYVSLPEDIEDFCAEVWLRVVRKAHLGPNSLHKDDVAPWLTTVADNVGKNLKAKTDRQVDIVNDSQLTCPETGDDDAPSGSWIEQMVPSQNTAEDEQLLSELMFRAANLSEQEAAVFNLVYWHGQSYEAVSKKFGITSEHVGVVCSNIRNKLEVKELYHKAYTYHGGGNVWADWSFKHLLPGQCVQRLDLIDKYNEFAPDVGCSETELRTAIRKGTDAILKQESNKNGITTSNWFDSAGFEQTL